MSFDSTKIQSKIPKNFESNSEKIWPGYIKNFQILILVLIVILWIVVPLLLCFLVALFCACGSGNFKETMGEYCSCCKSKKRPTKIRVGGKKKEEMLGPAMPEINSLRTIQDEEKLGLPVYDNSEATTFKNSNLTEKMGSFLKDKGSEKEVNSFPTGGQGMLIGGNIC